MICKNEARDINGNLFINGVPPLILTALEENEDCFLAGGAIRDLFSRCRDPKDYDFFFLNTEAAKNFNWWIMHRAESVEVSGLVLTAKIGSLLIQSIGSRNYETPEEIKKDFDFKNVCGYMTKDAVCTEVLEDGERKKVAQVNVIKKPIKEIKRLADYKRKGYECGEAYKYISSLIETSDPNVILMTDFYDDIKQIEKR